MVNGDFNSAKILRYYMNGTFPGGVPDTRIALVDVRDVAKAHMLCLKIDQAQGKRFLLCHKVSKVIEISQILHAQFAHLGYPI